MDAKEKLLGSIEERLTVYANWVNQGGGIRSDGAEYLYCDLLNEAFGYELKNMNRIRDNFPAIDLGDAEEGLAVQVTSTGDADKVKKTLKRFYDHGLEAEYDRLIVVIAGKAECKNAKFDHPGLELEIWGTAELIKVFRERLSMKNLKKVAALLQERVDAPTVKEPVLHLPVPERRNPVGFLGRKAELAWLGDELKKGTKPVIVAGLGGVGKTALAVEFQKGWRGNVYFATFRDTFTRTLADSVGQAIPVQERQGMNEEQTAALALEYLSRCEPGDLLIVDNAEVTGKKWRDLTADPFYEKLRRLRMAVLMTTRHRDTGGKWLGRLEQEELREIFRRHEVQLSEGEMDALINAVDGHTMTVDMIARTIRESWGVVSAEKILTAMKDNTLNEGDFDEIETDHDKEQRQIYAHLRALFDLSGIGEDGRQALRCATLLPQNGMQDALFVSALPKAAATEIKLLEKKGWVDLKEGLVTIHPVVRLVCRTELKPTDGNCKEFILGVDNQYDYNQYDAVKFQQIAEVFENADHILGDETGFLSSRSSLIWKAVGELKRAQRMAYRAMECMEKKYPNSDNLSAAYNNLGLIYGDLGEHDKSLEYRLKALSIIERTWDEKDIGVATICNNVGTAYHNLGKYKEALKYYLKALRIREELLSADHLDLAQSYNNMGCTYSAMGEHQRGLELKMKSLLIRERILGLDHPDTAQSYNNVGSTYSDLGDYNTALKYQKVALGIYGRKLLNNNPMLAQVCNSIAKTYCFLEQFDEAVIYMHRAAKVINASSLPTNHPQRLQYNQDAILLMLAITNQKERQGKPLNVLFLSMDSFGNNKLEFGK